MLLSVDFWTFSRTLSSNMWWVKVDVGMGHSSITRGRLTEFFWNEKLCWSDQTGFYRGCTWTCGIPVPWKSRRIWIKVLTAYHKPAGSLAVKTICWKMSVKSQNIRSNTLKQPTGKTREQYLDRWNIDPITLWFLERVGANLTLDGSSRNGNLLRC